MSINHLRTIVIGIILGTVIFLLSNALSVIKVGIPPSAIVEFSILLLSLIAIYFLSKGHISNYGFKKPRNVKWVRMIIIALALGAISTMTVVLSGSSGMPSIKNLTFPQIVLIVWLLASVAEEILTRGLIQSYLSTLSDIKVTWLFITFDIPTIISALFFSAMHIIVLFSGADISTVAIVMIYTFLVGLLAGYNRAQSQSLVPAIVLHASANIGGVVGGILITILTVLITGNPPSM